MHFMTTLCEPVAWPQPQQRWAARRGRKPQDIRHVQEAEPVPEALSLAPSRRLEPPSHPPAPVRPHSLVLEASERLRTLLNRASALMVLEF